MLALLSQAVTAACSVEKDSGDSCVTPVLTPWHTCSLQLVLRLPKEKERLAELRLEFEQVSLAVTLCLACKVGECVFLGSGACCKHAEDRSGQKRAAAGHV